MVALTLALSGCPWYWHEVHHHHDESDDLYVPMPVSNLHKRLAPDDVIKVRTIEDKFYRFRVHKVEEEAFIGTASDSKNYKIRYDTIAEVWIRRV